MTTCFRDALNRIGVPSEKSEINQEEAKSESNNESEIKEPLPQPEHVVLHLRNIKGSLGELHSLLRRSSVNSISDVNG